MLRPALVRPAPRRAAFPGLIVVREIRVGQFVQRIDALVIFAWTVGTFIKLAVNLYLCVLGVAEELSIENPRPLVAPVAALLTTPCIAAYSNLPEGSASCFGRFRCTLPWFT